MTLATLNEKTGISTGLVIVLIGAITTGVGTGTTALVQQQNQQKEISDFKAEVKERQVEQAAKNAALESTMQNMRFDYGQRLALMESAVSNINATMSRIEGKIDRQGQVVNASNRGRGP